MSNTETHIVSILVHVAPSFLGETQALIKGLDGAEIYGISEEGKVIVVLEAKHSSLVTKTIDKICDMPHVLNAALVYHEIDKDVASNEGPMAKHYSEQERCL